MPIKQNAKKAMRQARKRAAANLVVRNVYKKAVKVARETIAKGEDAKELMRLAQKALDKAAKKRVLKKNTASRKLSRLAGQIKAVAKKK